MALCEEILQDPSVYDDDQVRTNERDQLDLANVEGPRTCILQVNMSREVDVHKWMAARTIRPCEDCNYLDASRPCRCRRSARARQLMGLGDDSVPRGISGLRRRRVDY